MASAEEARASVCAGAALEHDLSARQPADFPLTQLEVWVRRAVPAMVALFAGALIVISVTLSRDAHDRAMADAFNSLELTASMITENLSAAFRAEPRMELGTALAQAVPSYARAHGQQVLVSDADGNIIGARPSAADFVNTNPPKTLNDYLGPSQPLTVFAEKAGVLRIDLADGSEALATVHTLNAPFGQVAVLYPLPNVLAEWETSSFRAAVLVIATVIVLTALALAYFWQASRARDANQLCLRMQGRVDAALGRGRCGLWDWDLARGRIYWSDSMYEILGLTAETRYLSFGDIHALIHPQDGDLASMAEMLASGQADSIDHAFRMRNVQGEWVWLRARAELVREHPEDLPHLVGIAVDITEQKALAERSATADLRLRDAIETVSEAFVLWDADNRLVMCNSKFQKFHHLSNEAVAAGTPYAQVMARGTPPVIQTQIALGERPLASARTYEARLGDGRWLQINERRTKDGGYVSVGTDITALKRHEEQLMESERRLMATVADLRKSRQTLELQAQQLADLAEKYFEQKAEAETANRAKSEFLANMSHELRTPLNHIIGFADMMWGEKLGPLGSPKYVEYCQDIKESGEKLRDVIEDVLDMSQLESGRFQIQKADFAIDDAIGGAIAEIRTIAAEKDVMVSADLKPSEKLHADQKAIEKIFTILLRNAVKYTPSQGRVRVRTRFVLGALNVYVEDSGMGIAPAPLARLGRPFEQLGTLTDGMKGTGLGLAIARSLVDLHGGSIRIKSSVGVGTIVLVHLPVSRDMPRQKLLRAAGAFRRPAKPAQRLRAVSG
ncbi:MAG TPA: ATP-binding protein [Methylocella sp.]|nr:ATP-binding protein [Methylocella sp.]